MEKENFESSLKKLEAIVRELENGDIDLDKSIEKYKEASKLVNYCSNKLKDATDTINKIMKEDGTLDNIEENE